MMKVKKMLFKRLSALIVTFSLAMTASAAAPYHQLAAPVDKEEAAYDALPKVLLPDKTPRAALSLSVFANGNKLTDQPYNTYSDKVLTIEAVFSATMVYNEPVTLTLTNGAQLLIESDQDIEYLADNKTKAISNLNVNADRSKATFEIETAKMKSHRLSFQIKVPSRLDEVENFELFTKIGTGLAQKTSSFHIVSGLTIEAPDIINNIDDFMIEGDAFYEDGELLDPSEVFVEMIHKETGEPLDEIQFLAPISADNRYSFGPLHIPDTYESGIYLIRVYLVYDQFDYLDVAQKEVTFVHMDPVEMTDTEMRPDNNIYANSRVITLRGFTDEQTAAYDWKFNLSVTGNAKLSKSIVTTDSTGKAVFTVTDSSDEYVIVTAVTENGITTSIPVDFRSTPNLAFNQTVRTSDVPNDDPEAFGAEKLIDGLKDTRWASGNAEESWVEIDFAEPREINSVTIKGYEAPEHMINNFKIEYFANGEWQTAYELGNNAADIDVRFPNVTTEKFRINLNGNSTSIYELSIYKKPGLVLTVRDSVRDYDRNGNKLLEVNTIRQFTYEPGTAITDISPLSGTYDKITVSIPDRFSSDLNADGNVVSGTMPKQDAEISYVYESQKGEVKNINVDFDGNELKLSEAPVLNYMWVANSSKGTVVLIDTEKMTAIAEYKTAPDGQPKNPSRTTTDKDGNVWVTNRDGNSVIKIGLASNGGWIDKNGNGVCDTSTGLGDIKAWTNAGGADTNGGMSTAEDECILEYIKVSSPGTRHLSVDEDNNVWVSGTGNRKFDLIQNVRNTQLGKESAKIIRTEQSVGFGGYGGLISYATGKGVIWSSNPLLRWEVDKPLTGANGTNWRGYTEATGSSYGLGVDSKGNVWNSVHGAGIIRKYAPDGTLIGSYNQGKSTAQGVAVDKNDHVWVAHSSGANTIGHLDNNGNYLETITVTSGSGTGPTGIAVSEDNKIWVTCYNGTVQAFDPGADSNGPTKKIGEIKLDGQLYNYSDMTGSTLSGEVYTGTHEADFETAFPGIVWNKLTWEGENAHDDLVDVEISTSDDGITYLGPMDAKEPFSLPGAHVRIVVRLTRSSDGQSPIVRNMVLSSAPY